jgi:hypothetical protein
MLHYEGVEPVRENASFVVLPPAFIAVGDPLGLPRIDLLLGWHVSSGWLKSMVEMAASKLVILVGLLRRWGERGAMCGLPLLFLDPRLVVGDPGDDKEGGL